MIIAISKDDPWWEKTRAFAKDCPWLPGRRLAERMSKNDFLDWEKVFVAVHGEDVVGFCVLEENLTSFTLAKNSGESGYPKA